MINGCRPRQWVGRRSFSSRRCLLYSINLNRPPASRRAASRPGGAAPAGRLAGRLLAKASMCAESSTPGWSRLVTRFLARASRAPVCQRFFSSRSWRRCSSSGCGGRRAIWPHGYGIAVPHVALRSRNSAVQPLLWAADFQLHRWSDVRLLRTGRRGDLVALDGSGGSSRALFALAIWLQVTTFMGLVGVALLDRRLRWFGDFASPGAGRMPRAPGGLSRH